MSEKLISVFEWVHIIATGIAFIVSIRYKNKQHLFLIRLYILASFLNNIILKLLEHLAPANLIAPLASAEINIYSIIQTSLLILFIYKKIQKKVFRSIILIIYLLYPIIWIIIAAFIKRGITSSIPPILGLEGILIIIPCLFYYSELLKSDFGVDFMSNDSFIIICGIFFYFSTTIPFYFFYFILFKISLSYYFFYVSFNLIMYSVFFVLLIKAYLCPYQEQKL
jgi:hypothetical protein